MKYFLLSRKNFLIRGTRNQDSIPLVELKVLGERDRRELREWVETWGGAVGDQRPKCKK